MKILFPVLLLCLSLHTATAQMYLPEDLEVETATRFPYMGKLGLEQNSPNPFTAGETTSIRFKAIDATHAVVLVYDEDGRKVLVFENLPPQTGKIHIRGDLLLPGEYTYALVVDGRMVSKRKLMRSR